MTVRRSLEDASRSVRRAVAGLGRLFKDCHGELGWSTATIALAEFLATGLMVFFICLAGVVGFRDQEASDLQKALSSGCSVSVLIQIFGHISSAHFNPAVTLAAVILGKINIPMAVVYVLAQCGGAILGYGFMQVLLPVHVLSDAAPGGSCCALCVTLPHKSLSALQSLVLEAVSTAFLVLMVCSCWDDRNRHKQDSVALKFAFLITAVSSIVGPLTGASMNPARTLGPAVWTNRWEFHWIYWLGPTLGAVVAACGYKLVFDADLDRRLRGSGVAPPPDDGAAAAKAAEVVCSGRTAAVP